MITNEREYKITKQQLGRIHLAIQTFDLIGETKRLNSHALAFAEKQALESEEASLSIQLKEYETLRSGIITTFKASSLAELPEILIRARIAQRLSQKNLAERIGLKEQQIQRYESERYNGASLRRLKEIAESLNINLTEVGEISSSNKHQTPISKDEINWRKFPIKEMYKRQWFEGFSGSIDEVIKNADVIVRDFMSNNRGNLANALYRKKIRSNSSIDQFALLAWESRIINLASREKRKNKYKPNSISADWMMELRRISNRSNGPILAKDMLKDIGISFVIEPYLSNTFLDGAAILWNKNPIIGMTLRFDRIDNFWFVLFHELFHIKKHLDDGNIESIFDDIEASTEDSLEIEADALASEILIPKIKWDNSLARFLRTKSSIIEFAEEIEINPAIVAGRIRFEANNYVILNDLVGQREVRKLFPEINFGV